MDQTSMFISQNVDILWKFWELKLRIVEFENFIAHLKSIHNDFNAVELSFNITIERSLNICINYATNYTKIDF